MPPEKSGYYYPNKFARIFLDAMEEVMGKNGLNAVLNLAGLPNLIGNYPPDNLEKVFDFADFTALCVALEEMYGPRSGRRSRPARRTHPLCRCPARFRCPGRCRRLAFKVLPLNAKLKVGVPAMANIFSQFSDQVSNVHEEGDDRVIYTLERCPMCWGRKTDKAVCYEGRGCSRKACAGSVVGREFEVDLSTCTAKGDDIGRYVIYKEPID